MPRSIAELLKERSVVLGLSRVDIVKLCGFKNITKGLQRLDDVYAGRLTGIDALLKGLPDALKVTGQQVADAVAETLRRRLAEEDEAWRSAFVPHAIVITEHKRPTQITLAAMTGAGERLHIPLDVTRSPVTFFDQAKAVMTKRLRDTNGKTFMFFGRPLALAVNYSPDAAVKFDLDGTPIEELARAYQQCQGWVSVGGGRPMSGRSNKTGLPP